MLLTSKRLKILLLVIMSGLLSACLSSAQNPVSSKWQPLFDGRTLNGWQAMEGKSLKNVWAAQDGTLALVTDQRSAGDIMTEQKYTDFELYLEWKLDKGGNSGILYRVADDRDLAWKTGMEYQLLDDANYPRAADKPHWLAGSVFDLYAPNTAVVKAAGEYNSTRIVVLGNRVEHWLNGHRIVAYNLDSADWRQRLERSKFNKLPGFGRQPEGHIVLQNHGDPVWYRNIRIREL
ncbi:DUF1080 domain-containing protein [Pseudomaricurvus alkylphenolicus]|jgi:hypothetical protein|uniref:3-keto-disaccharide hydrolase n=1 Tax=Pseudomaricurvus alkylphenolicus TaxID=1306991 RepID=UPI00142150A8|nr:DUF1080 domain-containing protein [Pseudomaricurvus alkylphenolicus]NIB38216.1 DUF1080 domain-containing protein [Pseudomaricurvus alkylphenolicus]